jgi:hypothetical protein
MTAQRRNSIISCLALIVAAGCEGADGPPGLTGPVGSAGPQGPAAPPSEGGAPGGLGTLPVEGGLAALPSSCLSPCHGFNGIVEQWKTSTHYSTFISNLGGDEVATWTGPGACGNCHSTDALERRVAGSVGTSADGGVANLAKGQLEYRNPTTNALSEANYAGQSKVASVSCVTCHSVTDATDPHRTGKAYVAGSFPLRVPTGAADQATIEKSPDTTAVTGTPAGVYGTANTCIWCHKSRKDVTNYIGADTVLTSSHWGPHEGPQSDVFSAKGGYHYALMTYGTSTHQQKLTCVDCHMLSQAAGQDAGAEGGATGATWANHSFAPRIGACVSCHVGATTFDINGGEGQVKAVLFELQKALNDAGYLTRGIVAPYPPLQPSELTDARFELDLTRPGGGPDGGTQHLTADQAGAVYNYILIARGGALGVHNPKYTKQLVFDSYMAIKGVPPTTLPARPM